MRLGIALACDEGLEVALGDAHRGAEVMRDEFTALDPAAHRAHRHANELRHLGDGVKVHFYALLALAGPGNEPDVDG